MKNHYHILKYFNAFLFGALFISLIGTIQRMMIDKVPIALWYITPFFLGGCIGLLIKFWLNNFRKSKKTSEILQEIVPSAVMSLDQNRIITGWNKKAEEITGYKKNDVIGKKCNEVLCDNCELYCEIQVEKNPTQMSTYCKIKTAKGDQLTIIKTSETFIDDHGNLIVLESFSDITKFIEAEKKLISAKELAEKSDKLKTEFLAQMSHEIRTPVNSVLSFASLVKEELTSEMNQELDDSFKMIESGSNRIIRTIDLILDMAQLNTGTFDLLEKYVMLMDEIINPILKDFKLRADEKKLKLILIKHKSELVIKVDPYVVGQILLNLIDNAIKFTNIGEVSINIFESNKKLNIEIKDSGIGIAQEYQSKIYEPFSQEDQGYSRRYEGNGLGLSLVKKYCDLIGAEIFLTSKIQKGTIFRIEFPESILKNETIKEK